jgi:hypothetical protein
MQELNTRSKRSLAVKYFTLCLGLHLANCRGLFPEAVLAWRSLCHRHAEPCEVIKSRWCSVPSTAVGGTCYTTPGGDSSQSIPQLSSAPQQTGGFERNQDLDRTVKITDMSARGFDPRRPVGREPVVRIDFINAAGNGTSGSMPGSQPCDRHREAPCICRCLQLSSLQQHQRWSFGWAREQSRPLATSTEHLQHHSSISDSTEAVGVAHSVHWQVECAEASSSCGWLVASQRGCDAVCPARRTKSHPPSPPCDGLKWRSAGSCFSGFAARAS